MLDDQPLYLGVCCRKSTGLPAFCPGLRLSKFCQGRHMQCICTVSRGSCLICGWDRRWREGRMTAARNRGRFRLVQIGGKGPNSAWAEEGSASVAEESCAGGKSSKGGGVEDRSGLFGGVGFRGGHMKSQRGFEQAMFGASRIGANLRQERVWGEDAFQDDVATDRNADYAWSRCTFGFAKDVRRNSLSYGDPLSVRVAARLNATWRLKACGSRSQPLPMAAADWSRTM